MYTHTHISSLKYILQCCTRRTASPHQHQHTYTSTHIHIHAGSYSPHSKPASAPTHIHIYTHTYTCRLVLSAQQACIGANIIYIRHEELLRRKSFHAWLNERVYRYSLKQADQTACLILAEKSHARCVFVCGVLFLIFSHVYIVCRIYLCMYIYTACVFMYIVHCIFDWLV